MKLSFAVFLISCITSSLHGQSYPFPMEAAEWRTSHESSHCTGGSNRVYYWTEFFGVDTLINDIAYKNLMLWPRCIYINAGNNCPEEVRFPDDGINAVGGIREINNRVLFLKYNVDDSLFSDYEIALSDIAGGEEIVLFDFNWVIGDSVIYPSQSGDPLIFDIINSNVVNGRKKFVFHQRGFPSWFTFNAIEGIGGQQGLFNMYYADQTGTDYVPEDVCFIQNEEIVQSGRCTSPCELVSTNDLLPTQLRMYPNPTEDEFTIGLTSDSYTSVVKLYSLFGQLLYSDNNFEPNKSISTEKFGFNGWLYVVMTDNIGQVSTGILMAH